VWRKAGVCCQADVNDLPDEAAFAISMPVPALPLCLSG
jgi:hypothetical protein